MSGIGAINAYSLYSTCSSVDASNVSRVPPPDMADQMQADLDEALQAAGVSDETRAALEADLKTAFEEQLSSGSPPDPEQMKQTIDEVFEKYGLDAEDYMGRMRPGGRPAGPPPGGGPGGPQGSEDSEETDPFQMLLDALSQESEESGDAGTSALELSQQVLDILFGFDAEA